MQETPEPPLDHDVVRPGRHLLGPHVVGARVVVRRLLRGTSGPSGGPAFTDLLGTCLTWADGVCVVQPEQGEPVPIDVADIVSGKPVPPRPSSRHRVQPREAQVRALALWPDLETEPLGGWVLRHSPASSARRANSVLALGPPGSPAAEEAADRVEEWYAARTGRPIAAVLPDSAEDAVFRRRGWVLESHDADTVFQLAGVAQVSRRLRGLDAPVGVEARLVPGGHPSLVRAEVEHDGVVVASGVAACDGEWVGFRGIEVAPRHRRRGLGHVVMSGLVGWGAEQGATTAYLQVLGDNEPALRLYDRLGLVEHHRYRYLAPPS